MDFTEAYNKLNTAQREAVDTIDGPVLVVAGPGTGKTQLLSMRAANIVRLTDTQPHNILCLTFTDSAAAAMRKRLISLMGPDGNTIAVHTFHSFGADIINRHREYFYNGAQFEPADELTRFELFQDIFENLPHSSPLAKTMNGEFTSLRDAQIAISHLKRAGLLPDELLAVLDHNQAFCDALEPRLAIAFAQRLSKKEVPRLTEIAEIMANFVPKKLTIAGVKSLHELCTSEFVKALGAAAESGKTTSLTAWRNRWLEKNGASEFVFKDRKRTKKLRALAKIYASYRTSLEEQSLFDFDDMVSTVAHTLETVPELRFNLQEQYLYIMVDEFQDTNGAQMRLLGTLTDNPVHEGRPNILAVGDDDQAIYSFQGAELSNILDFAARYRDTKIVTLTDNYRSTAPILKHSREVITLAEQRLETTLESINKELNAHHDAPTTAELHQFATPEAEYSWIAERLAARQPRSDIAVLARNHKQLVALVPYLHAAGVPVTYERRNNVLESPIIKELNTLIHVVVHLADQRFDLAESHLPELLSYDFWGLTPQEVWQLSLNAYKQRRMWLELMLEGEGKLHAIAECIVLAAHHSQHQPLDTMLDFLIGSFERQAPETDDEQSPNSSDGPPEGFVSPLRAHYFNQERLQKSPTEYLTMLSNLRAIRRALQAWHTEGTPNLRSFIDFTELHERTNTPVLDTAPLREADDAVTLMTAHKAKGLEFETVIVLSAQDEIWGRKARHPHSSLSFPHNLPVEPAGATFDDALRLFYVAMTRAKAHLLLTTHYTDTTGKEVLPAEFLEHAELTAVTHKDAAIPVAQLQPGWEARHFNLAKTSQSTLLAPLLENYYLSATHVNNFIDVTRGGPQAFLLQNLLRFPQAMTPSQVFGKAIHAVLQRAHTHLSATGDRRPLEDILHDFELHLQQGRLSEREFNYLLEKGSDVLQRFLAARYDTFTTSQKAERSFAGQQVALGDVRLTGAIDLMEINDTAKLIVVTDYKTGKGLSDWHGKTDFEKIKLHKYRQQLMFYKLLIENARDYRGYKVERGVLDFVEPDSDGQLHRLTLTFDPEELLRFKNLLRGIWKRILALDLPDTSSYDPSYKGILHFEQDLLE
ncbi:MAG TPA: ATP-dependent DNA helicase [Magnetospirillaceae bacterium]|nr:ATP-dependent DNA helicase [Magnetospirillaceae bacterium]